mmetsp:Transcript_22194/g.51856  ORF Transcript_22194/g.51856 Transcript_22194/m.51856 type:complete len:242 (-) Transcript_22194:7-732(-)
MLVETAAGEASEGALELEACIHVSGKSMTTPQTSGTSMAPRHNGQDSGGGSAERERCRPCCRNSCQQSVQKRWLSVCCPTSSLCGGTSVCSFSSMQTTHCRALAIISLLPLVEPGAQLGGSSLHSGSSPVSSSTRSLSTTGPSAETFSSPRGLGGGSSSWSGILQRTCLSSPASITRTSSSGCPSFPSRSRAAATRAPSTGEHGSLSWPSCSLCSAARASATAAMRGTGGGKLGRKIPQST